MQNRKSAQLNGNHKTQPGAKTKGPRVSNLVKADPTNPIPFERHNSHAFSFANNDFYLPFLSSNSSTFVDNYAQHLLEARLLSATNDACITTKKDYCAGDGFMDTDGKELDQKILDWFATLNLCGDHVAAVNQAIFEDFFTWGNVPIELVRFKNAGKKYFF
ncbi:MAG TPA: hypothetical protein VN457_07870, partial [Chlamydiales bacterium]|nr:hypothetical protein [Chlamydiales bacterium]